MHPTSIQQKSVLVTGASRGIGRALVLALLARGARRVYAAARDPKSVEGLVAEGGGRVIALGLDVNRPETIAAAAARVTADGGLDLLVNNAGLLGSGSLLGDLEAVERDFETNFFGTLRVTRAFAPLLEQSKGALANLLTVVAWASMPALGGYSASKAAALSMTQALRGELGKRGVSVHAVFPGPVDTEMAKEITLPKTSPTAVAAAILDGIERGAEDIFPDPMSAQVGAMWAASPKAVEQQFAAM